MPWIDGVPMTMSSHLPACLRAFAASRPALCLARTLCHRPVPQCQLRAITPHSDARPLTPAWGQCKPAPGCRRASIQLTQRRGGGRRPSGGHGSTSSRGRSAARKNGRAVCPSGARAGGRQPGTRPPPAAGRTACRLCWLAERLPGWQPRWSRWRWGGAAGRCHAPR